MGKEARTTWQWSIEGHECPICGEIFLGKKLLKNHKAVEHSY